MFEQVVPVSNERHGGKKVRPSSDFRFAAGFHIAYVTTHEFARAAATYPVVFLEDKASDGYRPVVLLGLEPGENLFVDAQGQWSATYIPAIIRRYPFALVKATDADRFIVCVDEASDLLSDTEGTPLFDEAGNPTQVIENVKRYLGELQQMDQITVEFSRFLVENNLLTPLNMKVNAGNQVRNITGCYVINEERLSNFSEAKFLEVRQKGYLPAIYAHLISLSQVERVAGLKKPAEAAPAPLAAS
ncbi:MAG: SapC family protein [Betaproteobacteria bacterium]